MLTSDNFDEIYRRLRELTETPIDDNTDSSYVFNTLKDLNVSQIIMRLEDFSRAISCDNCRPKIDAIVGYLRSGNFFYAFEDLTVLRYSMACGHRY